METDARDEQREEQRKKYANAYREAYRKADEEAYTQSFSGANLAADIDLAAARRSLYYPDEVRALDTQADAVDAPNQIGAALTGGNREAARKLYAQIYREAYQKADKDTYTQTFTGANLAANVDVAAVKRSLYYPEEVRALDDQADASAPSA
jgi:hypothetical protein